MAKERAALIYKSILDSKQLLPEDDYRLLLDALVTYQLTGELLEMPPHLTFTFMQIKPTVDAAINRWNASSENGCKGGAPVGNRNAKKKTTEKQPDIQPEKQPDVQPENNHDIDKDIDIDKDRDKDTRDKDKDNDSDNNKNKDIDIDIEIDNDIFADRSGNGENNRGVIHSDCQIPWNSPGFKNEREKLIQQRLKR